ENVRSAKENPMTKGSPISPSLMANKAPATADAAKTKDVAASVSSVVDGLSPVIGPNNIVPPTEMTGSQAVVRSLAELGVDDVFGLPGGAILPTYDPLMDSVPMVAITGQVSSAVIGSYAFQEADIFCITMPVTKHSYLVTKAQEIPRVLAEAFHIATTGRPGPVLVDIAKDAQQAMMTFSWPPKIDLP